MSDTYCAVYAIGPVSERHPVKIGYSQDPRNRIYNLAKDRGQLDVLALAWFVDRRVARRIEQRCHRIVAKAHKILPDGWYDIDAEWAKRVIAVAAQEEGINWITTSELQRLRDTFDSRDIDKMMEWSERRQLVTSKG